jgi:peptidoglycan/LPS O-acetylase OafA/YrhL
MTTLSFLHFGGPDLVVVLLFAVLILSVVVNTGTVATIANRKPLIWLGNISYSLYLLHGFFQFAIAQLLIAFGVQKGSDLSIKMSSVLFISMVAACLVSATAAYYGVEIVWRRHLKEVFGLRKRLYGVRGATPEPAGSN